MAARDAGTLRERWHALRDRLLASPTFQRRAASFALTRPIARRRARETFDLVAGFVYSQVLYACVRLRLFERLADGPQPLTALARGCELSEDAMHRLVAAAVSLRLLQARSHGRVGLGPLGAAIAGNAAITAMVEHHGALYADLRDPLALLRGSAPATALAAYWPYAADDAPGTLHVDRVAAYSALMSASQPLVAHQVLDAYPMRSHRCVLDVGGGEGVFLAAVAQRWPHLRLMLFDLPAVTLLAREKLAALGLGDRVAIEGGDFFVDALPAGADLIALLRVVHDHDDAHVLALLRSARRALAAGGTLLIAEPMSGVPGAEPVGDAYFGFYLLAMGRGRARSASELRAMLLDAGFVDIRPLRSALPLQASLLVARAPLVVNPEARTVNRD